MKRCGMNVRLTDLLYRMVDFARLLLTRRGVMEHGGKIVVMDAVGTFQEGRM